MSLHGGRWECRLNGLAVGVGDTPIEAFDSWMRKKAARKQYRAGLAQQNSCIQCGAPWYATWGDGRCRKCQPEKTAACAHSSEFKRTKRQGTMAEVPLRDPLEMAIFGG